MRRAPPLVHRLYSNGAASSRLPSLQQKLRLQQTAIRKPLPQLRQAVIRVPGPMLMPVQVTPQTPPRLATQKLLTKQQQKLDQMQDQKLDQMQDQVAAQPQVARLGRRQLRPLK